MSKLYPKYEPETYHSRDIFQRVVESHDLRIVWAYKSAGKWNADPEALLAKCKPECSCCGSKLNYGLGKNNPGKVDVNMPSTDHIVSQDQGKRLGWTEDQIHHIDNLWIICMRCNLLKNNSTPEDIHRYENIVRVLKEGVGFAKDNNTKGATQIE